LTSARIHHSKPGSPHERGLDFGYGNAELVAGTVATYRRLFGATRGIDDAGVRAAGAEIRERVGRDWPALADEIAAIAHGSGVDEAELFAVNARTELLAGQLRGECSTLALRNPGQPALMQNWDWHPDLAPSRIVWIVDQGEGRWFATFTEAGILAKIGLNSRGLAVCLNLLATDADGGLDGLPLHLALRLILETCEDAEDVRQLLADAPMGGSSCITVMTPGGEPAIFECHPGGPPLEPAVGREWAAHTNHFLGALPGGLVDTLRRDWPDTDARLARATAALSESSAEDDAVAVLRDHADGPISVCCHDGGNPEFVERQQTLASIVMHPREREMLIAWGQPCSTGYELVRLPR
jgi:isopenicillin-N N-acyltransferase-like protein